MFLFRPVCLVWRFQNVIVRFCALMVFPNRTDNVAGSWIMQFLECMLTRLSTGISLWCSEWISCTDHYHLPEYFYLNLKIEGHGYFESSVLPLLQRVKFQKHVRWRSSWAEKIPDQASLRLTLLWTVSKWRLLLVMRMFVECKVVLVFKYDAMIDGVWGMEVCNSAQY